MLFLFFLFSHFPSLFPYPVFYPHLKPTLAKFAAISKIKRCGECRLNSRVIKKLGFWGGLEMFRGTAVQVLLYLTSRKGQITQANMHSSALATRTRKLFLQNNSSFFTHTSAHRIIFTHVAVLSKFSNLPCRSFMVLQLICESVYLVL